MLGVICAGRFYAWSNLTTNRSVLSSWDSELIEFNCESDHAHLIVSYPPHKLLSSLIANLKARSSKTMWRQFESIVSKVYYKSGARGEGL